MGIGGPIENCSFLVFAGIFGGLNPSKIAISYFRRDIWRAEPIENRSFLVFAGLFGGQNPSKIAISMFSQGYLAG